MEILQEKEKITENTIQYYQKTNLTEINRNYHESDRENEIEKIEQIVLAPKPTTRNKIRLQFSPSDWFLRNEAIQALNTHEEERQIRKDMKRKDKSASY